MAWAWKCLHDRDLGNLHKDVGGISMVHAAADIQHEPLHQHKPAVWLKRAPQIASAVAESGHAWQGNYENGAAYTFILLITFWILYSYLVPISLFVTMEIVKFWQVGKQVWHLSFS